MVVVLDMDWSIGRRVVGPSSAVKVMALVMVSTSMATTRENGTSAVVGPGPMGLVQPIAIAVKVSSGLLSLRGMGLAGLARGRYVEGRLRKALRPAVESSIAMEVLPRMRASLPMGVVASVH